MNFVRPSSRVPFLAFRGSGWALRLRVNRHTDPWGLSPESEQSRLSGPARRTTAHRHRPGPLHLRPVRSLRAPTGGNRCPSPRRRSVRFRLPRVRDGGSMEAAANE